MTQSVSTTRAPRRGRLTPPATLAQGKFQLNMKGAERGGPRIYATSDLIMPRGTCAELIALSVLCCMLAMSRSDRQYSSTGVIGEEKNAKRTEMEDNINDEIKKTSTTHVLPVPGTWYFA